MADAEKVKQEILKMAQKEGMSSPDVIYVNPRCVILSGTTVGPHDRKMQVNGNNLSDTEQEILRSRFGVTNAQTEEHLK